MKVPRFPRGSHHPHDTWAQDTRHQGFQQDSRHQGYPHAARNPSYPNDTRNPSYPNDTRNPSHVDQRYDRRAYDQDMRQQDYDRQQYQDSREQYPYERQREALLNTLADHFRQDQDWRTGQPANYTDFKDGVPQIWNQLQEFQVVYRQNSYQYQQDEWRPPPQASNYVDPISNQDSFFNNNFMDFSKSDDTRHPAGQSGNHHHQHLHHHMHSHQHSHQGQHQGQHQTQYSAQNQWRSKIPSVISSRVHNKAAFYKDRPTEEPRARPQKAASRAGPSKKEVEAYRREPKAKSTQDNLMATLEEIVKLPPESPVLAAIANDSLGEINKLTAHLDNTECAVNLKWALKQLAGLRKEPAIIDRYTPSELAQLYQRAVDYTIAQSSKKSTFKCRWMYRDKTCLYYSEVQHKDGGIMKKYRKDYHGDPKSPINGRLDGLFFNVVVDPKTRAPPETSLFGERRLHVSLENMLRKIPNVYFTDFYCTARCHYVTLVLTKSGSEADDFCREHLVKVDLKNNPFLLLTNDRDHGRVGLMKFRPVVEVFVTEDVDIEDELHHGAHFCSVSMIGRRMGGIIGISKNKSCKCCNINPEPEHSEGNAQTEKEELEHEIEKDDTDHEMEKEDADHEKEKEDREHETEKEELEHDTDKDEAEHNTNKDEAKSDKEGTKDGKKGAKKAVEMSDDEDEEDMEFFGMTPGKKEPTANICSADETPDVEQGDTSGGKSKAESHSKDSTKYAEDQEKHEVILISDGEDSRSLHGESQMEDDKEESKTEPEKEGSQCSDAENGSQGTDAENEKQSICSDAENESQASDAENENQGTDAVKENQRSDNENESQRNDATEADSQTETEDDMNNTIGDEDEIISDSEGNGKQGYKVEARQVQIDEHQSESDNVTNVPAEDTTKEPHSKAVDNESSSHDQDIEDRQNEAKNEEVDEAESKQNKEQCAEDVVLCPSVPADSDVDYKLIPASAFGDEVSTDEEDALLQSTVDSESQHAMDLEESQSVARSEACPVDAAEKHGEVMSHPDDIASSKDDKEQESSNTVVRMETDHEECLPTECETVKSQVFTIEVIASAIKTACEEQDQTAIQTNKNAAIDSNMSKAFRAPLVSLPIPRKYPQFVGRFHYNHSVDEKQPKDNDFAQNFLDEEMTDSITNKVTISSSSQQTFVPNETVQKENWVQEWVNDINTTSCTEANDVQSSISTTPKRSLIETNKDEESPLFKKRLLDTSASQRNVQISNKPNITGRSVAVSQPKVWGVSVSTLPKVSPTKSLDLQNHAKVLALRKSEALAKSKTPLVESSTYNSSPTKRKVVFRAYEQNTPPTRLVKSSTLLTPKAAGNADAAKMVGNASCTNLYRTPQRLTSSNVLKRLGTDNSKQSKAPVAHSQLFGTPTKPGHISKQTVLRLSTPKMSPNTALNKTRTIKSSPAPKVKPIVPSELLVDSDCVRTSHSIASYYKKRAYLKHTKPSTTCARSTVYVCKRTREAKVQAISSL